ncbi:MAG: hypothetical protein ACR2OZ_11575 [Verrucomicrobiales bacterium]
MIIGVNATKEAIFFAETDTAGQTFSIKIKRLAFNLTETEGLLDLFQSVSTLLSGYDPARLTAVAILRCCGGQRASSVEAIKAEAVTELAIRKKAIKVLGVTPHSLKKALQCEGGQKWRPRAKQLFNSNGQHSYWSQGADGAVAAAYKASPPH